MERASRAVLGVRRRGGPAPRAAARRRTVAGLVVAIAAAALGQAGAARAEEVTHARVILDAAAVHRAPDAAAAVEHVARRGDRLPIRARTPDGTWLQVALPDRTYGWLHAHAAHLERVEGEDAGAEAARLPGWLAPSALPRARGALALGGGAFGRGGVVAVRPSVLLDPSLALELTALAAAGTYGRLYFLGAGAVIHVGTTAPIAPFVALGGGYAWARPEAEHLATLGGAAGIFGGAGLHVSLPYRITLRVETRSYALLDEDGTVARLEVSGGLSAYF